MGAVHSSSSSQLYIYLQSVQAYISPPIAACFILGILWPRLNGTGAITSLLTGFVLGAGRFLMELKERSAGGHYFTSPVASWVVNMNFLHYAIFMFVICSAVLITVSLVTPAPERRQLAGLTFTVAQEKLAVQPVRAAGAQPAYSLARRPPYNGGCNSSAAPVCARVLSSDRPAAYCGVDPTGLLYALLGGLLWRRA